MAKEGEPARLPEERPPWGHKIRNFLSPRGIQNLETALNIYAPFTSDELDEDPAKKLQTAASANQYLEAVIEDIISHINSNYTKKSRGDLLTTDPILISGEFGRQMASKYAEIFTAGLRFSEAFIFNEVRERINGWLMTLMALRENQHRKLTKRVKSSERAPFGWQKGFRIEEQLIHGGFFTCLDRPNIPGSVLQEHELVQLSTLLKQFVSARDFWIPLLRGAKGEIQNPTTLRTAEELRRENNRISGLLIKDAGREVDQCQVENTTLFGNKHPLTMQFAPIDPSLGIFHNATAQIDFFEPAIGEVFAKDREAQNALKAQQITPPGRIHLTTAIQVGDYPPMFAGRFDGEINGLNIHKEALRKIDPFRYELLRRDILFYFAQLVCKRHTLEQMFGDLFAPRKKAAPFPPQRKQQESPVTSTEVDRKYPQDLIDPSAKTLADGVYKALEEEQIIDISPKAGQEDIGVPPDDIVKGTEDVIEDTKRRAGRISAHRRLGRLIVREKFPEEGGRIVEIIPTKPSRKARELAAAAGIELRHGGEFYNLGIIIHPEKVPQFLEELRKKLSDEGEPVETLTLEDLEKRYPKDFAIRHETWVSEGFRGNREHGIIETIQAEVKKPLT